MPTNEAAQTLDVATLKLAIDKVAGDYRRNTTDKIEFTYVERPSGRVAISRQAILTARLQRRG
jgi:hypothetical protein